MALLRASYRMAYRTPRPLLPQPISIRARSRSRLDQLAAGVCCPKQRPSAAFRANNTWVEREIINNLTVEVSFIDNRGVWLNSDGLTNAMNELTPSMLSQKHGLDVTTQATSTC